MSVTGKTFRFMTKEITFDEITRRSHVMLEVLTKNEVSRSQAVLGALSSSTVPSCGGHC
jgi:hypothetical protein